MRILQCEVKVEDEEWAWTGYSKICMFLKFKNEFYSRNLYYLSGTVDILILLVNFLPFPLSRLSTEKHSPFSSSSSSLSSSSSSSSSLSPFFHSRLMFVFHPRRRLEEEAAFSPLSIEERDRRMRRQTTTLREIAYFDHIFNWEWRLYEAKNKPEANSWTREHENRL